MRLGLKRCLGDAVPESSVYVALVARGIHVDGLRVCEYCQLVLETPRSRVATRCPTCRRHRPRYQVFPVADGGWHRSARLGPPWHHYIDGEPGRPRGAYYEGVCRDCGATFSSTDARQHLCRNCGGGPGRVRRQRGGSQRGRQQFRFTGKDGALSAVGGVVMPDGTRQTLEAAEGVITTDDAELAHQLEENCSLRRIEDG